MKIRNLKSKYTYKNKLIKIYLQKNPEILLYIQKYKYMNIVKNCPIQFYEIYN